MKYFSLIIIFLIPLIVNASSLKLCYSVTTALFTVGETCITYNVKDDELHCKSVIKSSSAMDVFRKISDYAYGIGDLKTFSPSYFIFQQNEGRYKSMQEYVYQKDKIKVTFIRYDSSGNRIKSENESYYNNTEYFEPFMLSMVFFKKILNNDTTPLKLFFKDKTYTIPFKIIGEEKVKLGKNRYSTIKATFVPNIKGRWLLVPTGEWSVYLDRSKLFLVRAETKFVFINADVNLTSIEGDQNLLVNIIKNYGK